MLSPTSSMMVSCWYLLRINGLWNLVRRVWTLAERCSNSLCGCKSLPGAVVFTRHRSSVVLFPSVCQFSARTSISRATRVSFWGCCATTVVIRAWAGFLRCSMYLGGHRFPVQLVLCGRCVFHRHQSCVRLIPSVFHFSVRIQFPFNTCVSHPRTPAPLVSISMGVDILVIVQHHRFSPDFVRWQSCYSELWLGRIVYIINRVILELAGILINLFMSLLWCWYAVGKNLSMTFNLKLSWNLNEFIRISL